MAVANFDFGGLFKLVDELFTSPEEKAQAKIRVLEIAAAGDLGQIGVNTAEAKSGNWFASGWRPFIGWVCGLAFAWAFIVSPFVEAVVFYIFAFTGREIDMSGAPLLDMAAMMPVLLGMLGLGGLRTIEKNQGVATE